MDLLESNWRPVPDFYEREMASVSRGYFRAMIFWLIVGVLTALSYSFQFVEGWGERLIPSSAEHSVGRLRMVHSSLMIFGVLMNGFLAGLTAACSPPIRNSRGSRGAGFLGFWIIQLALLGGSLGVLYGESQALPFFELPVWADGFLIVGWLFAMGSLINAVDPSEDEYAAGVFPWMSVAFVSGVVIMTGAAIIQFTRLPQDVAGRWIATLQTGLFHLILLPLGLAATQYFMRLRLPHGVWNRWWQGILALLLCASGALAGRELFEIVPLPPGMYLPIYLLSFIYFGVLILVLAGFALALRAAMQERLEPPPWKSRGVIWFTAGWIAIGVYLGQRYLILMNGEFREAVRFTDWVIGHHHGLLLLGLGSWVFGLLDELWPELRRSERWRMPLFADLHLVLTLGGGWCMVLSLYISGWVQSGLTESLAPWSEVVARSGAFWMGRVVAGSALLIGQILLLINLIATRDRTLPELRKPRETLSPEPHNLDAELIDPGMEEFLR